jgi:F-type H+-transporting ATPase subunit c
MDPASAKLIGAGLAAIGTGAAAIGVGNLFGQFLQGALRNPSAADGQFGRLIFGFAVTRRWASLRFSSPSCCCSPDRAKPRQSELIHGPEMAPPSRRARDRQGVSAARPGTFAPQLIWLALTFACSTSS